MKKTKFLLSDNKESYITVLKKKITNCKRCSLYLKRTHVVVGEGDLNADLMFIGEAPGAEEDREGKPFVGKSGQLLTKIIEAMGLKRENVYIANILKCRPPNNRDPLPHEIEKCLPYLFMQLDIISPKIIVLLGRIAGIAFWGKDFAISQQRGKFFEFRGKRVLATFHPAYLLMHPSAKKLVWEDMKKVMAELNTSITEP